LRLPAAGRPSFCHSEISLLLDRRGVFPYYRGMGAEIPSIIIVYTVDVRDEVRHGQEEYNNN